MGEGIIKTVIAGKNSNVIGNSESPLILRGQGIKVQWGNKFIDLIKNGKINVDSEKILKTADSIESVTTDGIYLIEDQIWVVIDKVKTQLSGNSDTTYISFLVEQPEITAEQKQLALTNIGFYYDTYEEAQAAGLTSGLIYVQGDNKLYIVKEGILQEYVFTTSNNLSEETLNKLYIEGYSLMVEGSEYATLNHNTILLHKELILKESLQSENATSFQGFRMYIKNGKSYLEIDKIIERDDKGASLIEVTYSELEQLIIDSKLSPKSYYLITDFQNPWEVTWENEPMYYEDQYTEINGKQQLSGIRNAMYLIVKAINYNKLEKQAYSLTNPDWIIHYDYSYKGPEEGGFRYRSNSEGELEYLPCKGIITYLKDEFGNEGNFNFRHCMFKQGINSWRYIMDKTQTGVLGKFHGGSNNKFFLGSIDINIQVFNFVLINNDEYQIQSIDSNIKISTGHKLLISSNIVEGNTFDLGKNQTEIIHTIYGKIIGNSFININGKIQITDSSLEILNNKFQDIQQYLIIGTNCENNDIQGFAKGLTVSGIFNNNYLRDFGNDIINRGTLSSNTILKCIGELSNNGEFINNHIKTINSTLSNLYSFINNNIESIENLIIKGNVENNIIKNIKDCIFNTFSYNQCVDITECDFQDIINYCIFNQNIVGLITSYEVKYCTFEYIDTLSLEYAVYHTKFHGSIGNITRQLPKHEKELLGDDTKKKDVYPNIYVVCVPEIIKKGMILMWYGKEDIPKGWAICDGNNGTPNLINQFIKGGDISEDVPAQEGLDKENQITLKDINLPEHKHIHKEHTHNISGISGTADSEEITVGSTSSFLWNNSTTPVITDVEINGVEGATVTTSSVDVPTNFDYRYVTSKGSHSHDLNISGGTVSNATSEEGEWQYGKTKPIKIEPKHFKLIFIMKIDDGIYPNT